MICFKQTIAFGLLLVGIAVKSKAQNTGLPENQLLGRKYKTGETYRYKLTMSEYHNGQFQFTNVAVCELKVIDSAGVPYDEIRWISKKVLKPKDTTDQTPSAVQVQSYRISLSGKGRVDLPTISVPDMTEPIQDFNTFFVAVSPLIQGMGHLKHDGDSTSAAAPVIADFSNGSFILKGQDCLDITMKLVNTTKSEVALYTSFMPPTEAKLVYLSNDLSTPVIGNKPNNFQMVTPSGKDLFNVNYGREYFYINSTIRRSDGKIVKANMYNQLNLKIRVNCDKDYKNWQVEVPFEEERKLTLELL
jgi:hypothetical protein